MCLFIPSTPSPYLPRSCGLSLMSLFSLVYLFASSSVSTNPLFPLSMQLYSHPCVQIHYDFLQEFKTQHNMTSSGQCLAFYCRPLWSCRVSTRQHYVCGGRVIYTPVKHSRDGSSQLHPVHGPPAATDWQFERK